MKVILEIEIDEIRRSKIAYDLGQYVDDLPDDVECEDWLNQMITDKFEELREAREVERK